MLLPKNIFIPVDQYQENTSQWLKSRSEETLHVDNCYARLLLVPTEANARALFDALDGYVGGKGGDWNKVSRNKSSDGLLGRMYNWLKLELKIINAIDFAFIFFWKYKNFNEQDEPRARRTRCRRRPDE